MKRSSNVLLRSHIYLLLVPSSSDHQQYKQNVSGSGKELGKAYVNFARNNLDQVRQKITDELFILSIFEASSFKSVFGSMFQSSLRMSSPNESFYLVSAMVYRTDQYALHVVD